MAQVGVSSRPSTGLVGKLPQIQHPLSRLGNPDNMDVRGLSRASGRHDHVSTSGRPLPNESNFEPVRSRLGSRNSRLSKSHNDIMPTLGYEVIPEGVEVTYGDPNKTRLPLFGSGNRQNVTSRCESRVSSRLSAASGEARLEIDELEAVLREKLKGRFCEIRRKFKENDPEQKGMVTREALSRIVISLLNRPVSQSQFNRLMERLGIASKTMLTYNEFYACFYGHENEDGNFPRWMDPVQRHYKEKLKLTATQVHTHLKEQAKQRVLEATDLLPEGKIAPGSLILKQEFRKMLNKNMFVMDDSEFDKLWDKYDESGTGCVKGETILKKLGIAVRKNSGGKNKIKSPIPDEPRSSSRTPKRKELERQKSIDIEKWLKETFRSGFVDMKKAFEAKDPNKSSVVSHDDFLAVLSKFGLKLEKPYIATFLARCCIDINKNAFPYREFLFRFQDRSEAGMAHNILMNPKHRFNEERVNSGKAQSTVSAVEAQLLNLFQSDFLGLLGMFHKIDKYETDLISQEEFRAAVESRFGMEFSEGQFKEFIDKAPLNEDGLVRYADFMAQFDTRGQAQSLFGSKSVKQVEEDDDLIVEKIQYPNPAHRPVQILFQIIKELVTRRYTELERAFVELDDINSMRLSQEMMFRLFNKLGVEPQITRGEIRDLWKTFIVNQRGTLDFYEFVRHFGYSLKSAAFPNAKIVPPRKGDNDLMMRSRKLNSTYDLLQEALRSRADFMWEDIRREFVEMDPYGTGCVSTDEFKDVMTELCVQLSDWELELIVKKFDLNEDGRVNYIEFLKPFALKRQYWRHGNNMLSLLQHSHNLTQDQIEGQKGLQGITGKMRMKLAGEWKTLRRAFKKLDVDNSGQLTLPEFKSVLKLANVILDDEEVFEIMNEFDKEMTGKIPYQTFINETMGKKKVKPKKTK